MEIIQAIFGWAILLALIVSPYYVIKWLRAADRRSAQKATERVAREHQRTTAGVPGKPERAFLKACTHCGVFALTLPFRDNLGRTYCSEACMQWLGEGPLERSARSVSSRPSRRLLATSAGSTELAPASGAPRTRVRTAGGQWSSVCGSLSSSSLWSRSRSTGSSR